MKNEQRRVNVSVAYYGNVPACMHSRGKRRVERTWLIHLVSPIVSGVERGPKDEDRTGNAEHRLQHSIANRLRRFIFDVIKLQKENWFGNYQSVQYVSDGNDTSLDFSFSRYTGLLFSEGKFYSNSFCTIVPRNRFWCAKNCTWEFCVPQSIWHETWTICGYLICKQPIIRQVMWTSVRWMLSEESSCRINATFSHLQFI